MLDRAVRYFREEYSITAGHVTDRLGRAGQETPPVELGAPELSIVLQHLRCVALGVEGDRNEGDLGTELRPQRVLHVDHLLRQQRADVRTAGIDEGQRHDLAAQIGERHRLCVLRGQGEGGRRSDHRQPLLAAGFMRHRQDGQRQQGQRQREHRRSRGTAPVRRHAAAPSNGTPTARLAARSSSSSEARGNDRRWASSR